MGGKALRDPQGAFKVRVWEFDYKYEELLSLEARSRRTLVAGMEMLHFSWDRESLYTQIQSHQATTSAQHDG